MFRSLMILTGSGIVIFEKEWVKGFEKPAKWGGLLRALLEFSTQCIGLPVSYMEFPSVSVTVMSDPKTKLICTLFHDADMQALAHIVTQGILIGFKEMFGDRDFSASIQRANEYASFVNKLIDCIGGSVETIVTKLPSYPGIQAAVLVYDDGGESIVEGNIADEIAVVANFQALLSIANQTLSVTSDSAKFMSLDMQNKIMYVHRVGGCASLLSICKKSVPNSEYYPKIKEAVDLLNKVFFFMSFYK